jgi:hypothetical protein
MDRWLVVASTTIVLAANFSLAGQQPPESRPGPRVVVGPNLRVSANTASGNRNECWIAASPANRRFLVAVSQSAPENAAGAVGGPRRCMTAISRNGGETWREITLPKQEDGAFDPMAVAGTDGRIYVMQAVLTAPPGGGSARREGTIRVWSTADEGRHWRGPAELKCPVAPDHPRMVVDTTDGPHRGRLYIAWNEVADTVFKKKFHIFLNYSDDGGQTFNDPILLGSEDDGKLVITEPIVLADGTLLVTYYQYFFPLSGKRNEHQPVYVLQSTDGGDTFGKPQKIGEVGSSGWRYLRRDFGRAFTLPIFTADTSPTSRYRDRLYYVWDDATSGQSSIWLSMSSDRGRTWSKPRALNDNPAPTAGMPPDFRMTPVVAVNRDGVVGVAWYDRRDDPTRRCWRQYFTASSDGGATFLPNVAISSAGSCPDKDAAPTVYVSNVAADIDDTLPSQDEIAGLPDNERRQLEEELGIAAALKEVDTGKTPRLRVAFDKGRNIWPGHYTGLTADPDGAFHALWADRRSKLQQLYTARIEVAAAPEPPAPPTREASVTSLVQVIGGPGKFDEANGTATFELQIRNVSDRPIYAPLKLRLTPLAAGAAGTTATIVDADAPSTGGSAISDFSKALGSRMRLDPRAISEARTVKIKIKADTGLDGLFEFEAIGHLPRGTESQPEGR